MYSKKIYDTNDIFYHMLRGIYGDAIADQFKSSRDQQNFFDENISALTMISETLNSLFENTHIGGAYNDEGYFDELKTYLDALKTFLKDADIHVL